MEGMEAAAPKHCLLAHDKKGEQDENIQHMHDQNQGYGVWYASPVGGSLEGLIQDAHSPKHGVNAEHNVFVDPLPVTSHHFQSCHCTASLERRRKGAKSGSAKDQGKDQVTDVIPSIFKEPSSTVTGV